MYTNEICVNGLFSNGFSNGLWIGGGVVNGCETDQRMKTGPANSTERDWVGYHESFNCRCAVVLAETTPTATTRREDLPTHLVETARLVAEGLSNAEIARREFITPGAVKMRLNRLGELLGIQERGRGALRVGIVRWWYEVRTMDQTLTPALSLKGEGVKRRMYCEECGESAHELVGDKGLDEVWRCQECGREKWFRTR